MTSIDLQDYIAARRKLGAECFVSLSPKKSLLRKSLLANAIDFQLCLGFTLMAGSLAHLSIASLMVSDSLMLAYEETQTFWIFTLYLPVIVFANNFFSFFFNDGQTYGMYTSKIRFQSPRKSFRGSLLKAAVSTSVTLTGGVCLLLPPLRKAFLDEARVHDYLYIQLVTERDIQPVNLIDALAEHETAPEMVEDYRIAA